MDFESQSTDCSIKTEHRIPLRSRRDMINALDHDCLSQIFSYLPLREILQSEEGIYYFLDINLTIYLNIYL